MVWTALIAIGMLLAQFALWRLWRTLFVLRPAMARLRGSDYREAEQNFDRLSRRPLSGLPSWGADENYADSRTTECHYEYEDEGGERHDALLTKLIPRGNAPDAAVVIWYDEDRPERWTQLGPGFWCLVLIASVAALAWLVVNPALLG